MTKTPKQIVDDFFFEHLGVDPELEPNEQDRFKHLNFDELYSLAQHVIGSRIGLRSSGHIKDGLTGLLTEERQNLFKLEQQQLKENIDFHSKKYKIEKQ